MRIVGGRLRGHRLATPDSDAIRPTSDRVREALFNILAHGLPAFDIEGAKVLDLFAGTGALGLEALSRGAAFCLFVEHDAGARGLIRRNIEAFGLSGASRVFRRDATSLGTANARDVANLVFLDPPYGEGLAARALASAAAGGWLAPGAIAVIEERADVQLALPDDFAQRDRRVYGDTHIVIARFAAATDADAQ